MASLVTLPLEIFYHLLEIKNFNVNLLNLRLTCRALNLKLRNFHLDRVYRKQNIFLTPIFLRNLLEISKDPFAPHLRARRLVIRSKVLNITEVKGLGRCYITPSGTQDFFALPHLGLKDEEAFINMECLAYDHTTSLREVYDGRHTVPIALLASVLSAFPRLETIYVRDEFSKDLSSFEFNIFYPSLGFGPGNCPSDVLRSYATRWLCLPDRLAVSGLSALQTIRPSSLVRAQGSIMNHWARDGLTGPPFSVSNLRQLDITFQHEDYISIFREGFGQWLEAIGSRLEYLRLGRYSAYPRPANPLVLPTSIGIPRLRSLEIQCRDIDVDNVVDFLYRSRATLESLRLQDCISVINKEIAFRFLKRIRTTLTKLRSLVLFTEYPETKWGIFIAVDGWAPTALFVGYLRDPTSPVQMHLTLKDLAGQLDANSEAQGFWDALATFHKQDYGAALSLNYGEGGNLEFDVEDHESDSDYQSSDSDEDEYLDPYEYVDDEVELDWYGSGDEFELEPDGDIEDQSDNGINGLIEFSDADL
ncbi:hypothetical protein TWF281_004230 [Arthrobotrys megalospora]